MNLEFKCVVACKDFEGESNLYFVKVVVEGKTNGNIYDKVEQDKHKKAAIKEAKKNGMNGPFIVFDGFDESPAFFDLFVWESASIITVN